MGWEGGEEGGQSPNNSCFSFVVIIIRYEPAVMPALILWKWVT